MTPLQREWEARLLAAEHAEQRAARASARIARKVNEISYFDQHRALWLAVLCDAVDLVLGRLGEDGSAWANILGAGAKRPASWRKPRTGDVDAARAWLKGPACQWVCESLGLEVRDVRRLSGLQ